MGYVCKVCGEEFFYRDEVVILDCNGIDSFTEEEGGSGDTYGILCITCCEEEER